MNAIIIRNPISGNPGRQLAFVHAVEAFTLAGWQVRVWETQYKGHARGLAEKAALEGYKCVIIAGGDGSIGQTVDGLLRSGVRDVALGVIPMGTGNVFAREAGLPYPTFASDDAPARAARIIIENEPVWADVGQANGDSFLCWAGVGLDAAITERVESQLAFKRRAPMLSYLLTALKSLVAYAPAEMQLSLDDGEVLAGRFPLAVASNIRLYARYFRITPGARINDGLLDLLIFTDASKIDTVYQIARLAATPNGRIPGLIRRQVRSVTITADPAQPYHLDGDPLGETPIKIHSLRRRLLIYLDASHIADVLE